MSKDTVSLVRGQRFTAFDLNRMSDVLSAELIVETCVHFLVCVEYHRTIESVVQLHDVLTGETFWIDETVICILHPTSWVAYSFDDLLAMADEQIEQVAS